MHKRTSGRNALTGGDPHNGGGDRNQHRLRILKGQLGPQRLAVKESGAEAVAHQTRISPSGEDISSKKKDRFFWSEISRG